MNIKTLITVCCFIAIHTVKAQFCGTSGPQVCTPGNNLTLPGFDPTSQNLNCAVQGVPYDEIIQLRVPATVTAGTLTLPLNFIIIESITNLPCGLCWQLSDANNRVNANQQACIRISGTTFDNVGQFKLNIVVTANVTLFGQAVNQTGQDASAAGLSYFVRVQSPGGNCAPVDTLNPGLTSTIVGAPFTATVSANGPTTFCQGSSVTLTASPAGAASYQWFNGTTPINGATNSTYTVNTSGNFNVRVVNNCRASISSSIAVTVNNSPTASISPAGTASFCQGSSVTLTASSSGSNPSYAWFLGANPLVPTGNSINASAAGSYTVRVTSNGCTTTSSPTVVSMINLPNPSITSSLSLPLCAGTTTTLDAGAGFSTYNWSTGATTRTINVSVENNYSVTVTQSGCSNSASIFVPVINPSTTISANGPTTFCTGSSVILDAKSGFNSYLWSNGATTQTVTIFDTEVLTVETTLSGCTSTSAPVSVVVSTSLSPQITATPSLLLCPGGTITLDAGIGFDSYLWSTGETTQVITGSTTGNFEVEVSLSGCNGFADVDVLPNNTPLLVDVIPNDTSACDGEIITLTATGASGNYLWNTNETTASIDVADGGDYYVVVENNGCVGTDTTTLVFNAIPSATITASGAIEFCEGDSVILDAGAGFDSYLWSNGATSQTVVIDATDMLSVNISLNNCSNTSASTDVIVNSLPSANVSVVQDTLLNATYLIANSSSGLSYAWEFTTDTLTQGSSVGTNNDTLEVLCSQLFGFYKVNVTDDVTGCSSVSNYIEPPVCVSVADVQQLLSLKVFPNPVNKQLQISYSLDKSREVAIRILDMNSKVVYFMPVQSQLPGTHLQSIDLSNISNGIYILNFITESENSMYKIIKQ